MCSLKLSTFAIAILPFFSIAKSLTQSVNNFTFNFIEGNRVEFDAAVEYRYVDNYLNQKTDTQSTSSQKATANSYIQVHNDHHLLQANLNADYLWFNKFDEDNHDEIDVKLKYFYKLNELNRFFVSGATAKKFEYRGTGSTKGSPFIADKGQEFDETLLNVGYLYGRSDSVSKISMFVGNKEKKYNSNFVNNDRLNYHTDFAEISLDYLISGKTYMSLLTSYHEVEYAEASEQNRSEYSVLTGIKWEPTQLSKLTALIGYQNLNFKFNTIDNNAKFKWLISYDWTPLNRLKVKLDTTRATEGSVDVRSNFVIKDGINVNASYDVNDFTKVIVNMNYSIEDTHFINQVLTEQVLTTRGELNYNITSSVTFFTGLVSNAVSSDVAINEYDSLLVNLGIKGNF